MQVREANRLRGVLAGRGVLMSSLVVRGGMDAAGRPLDVVVVDGVVASTDSSDSWGGAPDGRGGGAAPPGRPVLDATGLVVVPGLIDLQVNGATGVDLTAEPHRLWEVAAALVRYGVTAFLPTLITASPQARSAALATLAAGRPAGAPAGAVPLGLHFEGPMLAPSRKGAHPEHWLAEPSLELVDGWSATAGVAMVTLAPELPGALEVIRALVSRGVVVSIGHTGATTADVEAAVAAGATTVTHLYNAMPPLGHREPGPVGVALGGRDLTAGVIVDGHHLDPRAVVVAWRALRPDRFLAVSDTTAVLGLGAGRHRLGDQEVVVEQGAVRLADGTLAGSAASLPECLHTLMGVTGCSLADAVATATKTPARLLGDSDRGHLEPGSRADLVLLDPAEGRLRVVATVVAGQVRHETRR